MSKRKKKKDSFPIDYGERKIPKIKYLEVAIRDNLGQVARKMDIPTSLVYIDLSKYCDFLSWVLRIDKWLGEVEKDGDGLFNPLDPLFMKAYISQLARAIEAFGIIHDPGELDAIPLGDYNEHIKEFFQVKNPEMINLDRTQETLLYIYHNLFAIVSRYKPQLFPDDMTFRYRGQEFVIPKTARDRLTKKELTPDLSTLEAIEVLDLQGRVFRDKRSSDFDADLMFTQYLEQMAVLCRKKGELLPANDVALDRHVDQRKVFFAGVQQGKLPACSPISAALAIDIDFFLSMQLGLLRKTLRHVFSLTTNTLSPEINLRAKS